MPANKQHSKHLQWRLAAFVTVPSCSLVEKLRNAIVNKHNPHATHAPRTCQATTSRLHDHIRLRLSLGDSMDRDIFAPESVLPEKGNNVVAEGISCHNMHRLQLCGRGATVTDPIMHEREQLLVESVPAIEWRPPTACGAEGTVPV